MLVFLMVTRQPISATIITHNEEHNIARAIQSVQWADEILVVDSGSTDQTVQLATKLGARVLQTEWPGYGPQKNYAQDQAQHNWILNLDADEEVSDSLKEAILKRLEKEEGPVAFAVPRKTFYLGKWIRHGGWWPNHLVRIADRRCARWTEPEVHEHLEVQGKVEVLKEPLHHFTFRGIEDQVRANLRYSRAGSNELLKRGERKSLIKLLLKPVGKFLETYLIKKGFLDGIPGLIISVNAAHSMFLKYAYLFEPSESSSCHESSRH